MNADANLTGNFQFVCRQMGNRRIKILNYRRKTAGTFRTADRICGIGCVSISYAGT